MNPEQFTEKPATIIQNKSSKLETWAYYIFLATVFLAPLSFLSSNYMSIDLAKTVVIVLGVLVSAILYGIIIFKEKKLVLPVKSISWTSFLLLVSLVISSLISINVERSFFGQGFELGTVGFLGVLFVSALMAFTLVYRRSSRAILLYVTIAVSYFILYIFQALRLMFGPKFASLGILNNVTDSLVGGWFNVAIFSLTIAIISIVAIIVLPLSRKQKISYYTLSVFSVLGAFVVSARFVWLPIALVFLGLTIYFTSVKPKIGSGLGAFMRRLVWVPLIACIVFALFAWQGNSITNPVATKMYGGYSELVLPWQMTVDVTAGAIKNYPLFGIGPNHFVQAFLAYKPVIINSTNAWNVEFNNGFGLIPTLISAQGVVGSILWLLFFIFLGISGSRALRKLPEDRSGKFIIISSYASSVFLWLVMLLYVPSHAIVFLAFVLTGIFFGSSSAFGALSSYTLPPQTGTKSAKLMPVILILCIIVALVWGVVYAKKAIALSLFSRGLSELNKSGDAKLADSYFERAQSIDSSDVYWQARAEASILHASKLAGTLTASSPASTSEAVLAEVVKSTNDALAFSRKAIEFDPTNYYNFISEARVSETAASYKMANGYENALQAYGKAIGLNPFNPTLYLSLARLQARENKLDDAIRSIGASLQVKSNYLDAIFLLSQVNAAKGNLADAIIAAKVATEINPQNPLLFFQLGLLKYNTKDYAGSAQAFDLAVTLQPDYANARYFLGLSEARIGNTAKAIAQFENLALSNPDNQEVSLILTNLRAGKPIFADAQPPVTPNPEKRTSLPIKETKK